MHTILLCNNQITKHRILITEEYQGSRNCSLRISCRFWKLLYVGSIQNQIRPIGKHIQLQNYNLWV